MARIYEDSLSGIASKYVELEPGPSAAPPIPDGGLIDESHTYSEVNLDELFDTFDPLTRAGLQGFIRGEAASLKGKGAAANRALEYLAPGLQSASQVTQELTRDEPTFDQLVVQGAQALQALASRSAAAVAADRQHQHRDRRDRPPEPGAPGVAGAAAQHADALDDDVRRADTTLNTLTRW